MSGLSIQERKDCQISPGCTHSTTDFKEISWNLELPVAGKEVFSILLFGLSSFGWWKPLFPSSFTVYPVKRVEKRAEKWLATAPLLLFMYPYNNKHKFMVSYKTSQSLWTPAQTSYIIRANNVLQFLSQGKKQFQLASMNPKLQERGSFQLLNHGFFNSLDLFRNESPTYLCFYDTSLMSYYYHSVLFPIMIP